MARARKPHSRQPRQSPAEREPRIAPRLLHRQDSADYLASGCAQLDEFRRLGLITPIALPSVRNYGQRSRAVVYDRVDLDRLIDKLKAGGVG